MSAPSKEEIAEFISVVRDFSDGSLAAHAVAHLDDENERLRADRTECLALLNNIDVAGYKDGLDEWDEKRVALLEKLRGQQP